MSKLKEVRRYWIPKAYKEAEPGSKFEVTPGAFSSVVECNNVIWADFIRKISPNHIFCKAILPAVNSAGEIEDVCILSGFHGITTERVKPGNRPMIFRSVYVYADTGEVIMPNQPKIRYATVDATYNGHSILEKALKETKRIVGFSANVEEPAEKRKRGKFTPKEEEAEDEAS